MDKRQDFTGFGELATNAIIAAPFKGSDAFAAQFAAAKCVAPPAAIAGAPIARRSASQLP